MKIFFKYNFYFVLALLVLGACKSDDSDDPAPTPADDDPVEVELAINSIEPTSGPYDATVSIKGSKFSKEVSGNTVFINDVEASIISASDTLLEVTVPKGAGSGKVKVKVGDEEVTGPDFEYVLTPVMSIFAGDGTPGNNNGKGQNAQFNAPQQLALDGNGNLYVADSKNHVIRKITPDGSVTDFAGKSGESGYLDNFALAAKFKSPSGLAFDADGDLLVADKNNHVIRKIIIGGATGVTTVSGDDGNSGYGLEGEGFLVLYHQPNRLMFDNDGMLLVSEIGGDRIRKIDIDQPIDNEIFVAGSKESEAGFNNGKGVNALFKDPYEMLRVGDQLLIADKENQCVRDIDMADENFKVGTFVGSPQEVDYSDGTGTAAKFWDPTSLAYDPVSEHIFIGDWGNRRIRRTTIDGEVTTIVGNGTKGVQAGAGDDIQFNALTSMVYDEQNETLYISDSNEHYILKVIFE